MKKYRILSCILAVLMLVSLMSGCNQVAETPSGTTGETPSGTTKETDNAQQNKESITKIAFISNEAIDSEEWLQNLVKNLGEWEAKHPGIEVKVIEATAVDEYYAKTQAACEAGYQAVITCYSDMAEATIKCATEYPDIMFGTLDSEMENIENYPNIQDFRLNRNQTAFIQGCVAALMTKTDKVGFVGGGEYASIDELLAGWQQGIQHINPDIKDYVVYTNSFTDPTAGKEYALSLIAEGCDVIYGCAGGSGTGAAQAAEEEGIMYAACDVHYTEAAPNSELGSTLYYFDTMIIAFIEDCLEGNYAPGTRTEYGVAEGAGKYEFAETNSLVPDDVKAKIAEIEKQVAAGEFELSRTPLHK